MPEDDIEQCLNRLEGWFEGLDGGALTAFSGGVDSALVLFLSRRFLGPERAVGCISDSPSLKRSDLELANSFCHRFEIRLEIIHTQEIEDEAYSSNPSNRCFACKTHLYQDLSKLLDRLPGFSVLNGTNSDDFGDYRPGLQAAANHRVLSPLADCVIDKDRVRQLARRFELPNWNKPASPCLSSRIPYGQPVTRDKLGQIEAAEMVLNRMGFQECRVRHFGTEARIEVASSDIPRLEDKWSAIERALRALGFASCCIDREGLVSGKLNRALP